MTTRDNLLIYLKKNKNSWVSGQAISQELAVSRAAVNKHIKTLRQKGYEIASSTKKGYFFKGVKDLLLAAEIREDLDTRIFGQQEIVFLEETDSTNRQARLRAEKSAPEGTVVAADRQSSGRGRKGRSWFSPPGLGIYVSLILRPSLAPSEAPGITLMTAVAAAEAVIAATSLPARIKWPNDILVHGKKLAGILTEISTEMDSVNYIVVGLGLNVNTSSKDLPRELQKSATSVRIETGKRHERIKIIQAFLEKFEQLYDRFDKGGFASVREEWLGLTDIVGKRAVVEKAGNKLSGVVTDIDTEGVLVLEDHEKRLHRVFSGDLILSTKK